MSRLREARTSRRVSHSERIAGCRVNRSAPARLSRECPVRACAKRLPCRKIELIRHRGRGAGIALKDLTSHGVVLTAEADAGCPLNRDRDRQRCQTRSIDDADLLFVEPLTA